MKCRECCASDGNDTGTARGVLLEISSIRNFEYPKTKQSFFRASIPPVMRQEASNFARVLTRRGSQLGIRASFFSGSMLAAHDPLAPAI
jgi:hypothetical protein